MHRIDGAGATIDNLFTEGDPVSGIPATTVTGAWLNAIQEEIAKVIEQSGGTLNKPNNGQLYTAILAMIAAAQPVTTGDVKLTLKTTADTGWVMCNDGTIGPAGSGATTRANADCQALYTLLWTNVSNTHAPVTGGRGASAAADWAANKPIALTRMLGRALALAGTGSGLSARTLGQTIGAETHQLAVAEMPSHNHGISDPGHQHTDQFWVMANFDTSGGVNPVGADSGAGGFLGGNITSDSAVTGIAVQSNGGGGAHNNMQPTAFVNAMVKL